METVSSTREQWEMAAPGWAKWEDIITDWTAPATNAMFSLAGIKPGSRILDLACGAGGQTIEALHRVGNSGYVLASDISETMLSHVRRKAGSLNYKNIGVLNSPAEELNVEPGSFDAAICRLGLMLFASPQKVLSSVMRALKPGGKFAAVVFTGPSSNYFMAKPMRILLRYAQKEPPKPGEPGIFAMSMPGKMKELFADNGFTDYSEQVVNLSLRLPTADTAFNMMQDAFGAYRAVISSSPESVRIAAWNEVRRMIDEFGVNGRFEAPAEVMVAVGVKPGLPS
jgi:ubiquinone/menaquinone biosynthesis C-methylase UbiE